MKNISVMEYEELLDLDGEVLSAGEIEQLEEHELVTWFENLGESSDHKNCYWYDVQIQHPQDKEYNVQSINVYVGK